MTTIQSVNTYNGTITEISRSYKRAYARVLSSVTYEFSNGVPFDLISAGVVKGNNLTLKVAPENIKLFEMPKLVYLAILASNKVAA